MIKSLRDARITDALPRIVGGQDWVKAFAGSLGAVQEKILDFADSSQIYTALDSVPESILDALAVNWKIDWYDTGYTLEQKRRTVQNAIMIRRQMGTVKSVRLLLDSVYPGSALEEWFQYGGEPGYFRIVSADQAIGYYGAVGLLHALDYVKRLSAWLEVIILIITGPPFEEKPGELFFRRFIVSSALPGHPLGIALPSILWGGIRFSHFQGSARFDGTEDFDGSINFDQTFGAIPFRKFIVHAPFRSASEEGLSAALAVRFAFRRPFSIRFDSQTSFDGSVNFDQDLGYRLKFQRFLYNAAFRHREKSSIPFDGAGSFDGSLDFNQRYGAVGFPNIKFNIRNFVSERVLPGFLFRHTFHRRFSVRLDGSAGFDGTLDFDQAYGNRVMFPRCRFGAAFVHEKNHGGSPPPTLRVSAGFRQVKKPAVLACFAMSGDVSEQNRLAFSAFSVSGTKAPQHSGALAGKIIMDNWQVLDGSAKLDGTFKLDAYLKQEGI